MKKLGLIGVVDPETIISYYYQIIYGVQKRLNKPFFPPMVIEILSCFEIIRMSSRKSLIKSICRLHFELIGIV